jgi:hypothetical protein
MDAVDGWETVNQEVREAVTESLRKSESIDREKIYGWRHPETSEALIVRPNNDDTPAQYAVYHCPVFDYSDIYERWNLKRGVTPLFRDDSIADANERIAYWADRSSVPEEPTKRHRYAIDVETVCRNEIEHPTSLKEWAYLVGAANFGTEKIGSRKESNGDVALFEGSSRWGEGAYIALASEIGPRGHNYLSVGYESNGYYETDQSLTAGLGGNSAFEIDHPTVEFDGDTIIVTGRRDESITITATTGNPSECLHDGF